MTITIHFAEGIASVEIPSVAALRTSYHTDKLVVLDHKGKIQEFDIETIVRVDCVP